MSKQIPLSYPVTPAMDEESFLPAASNMAAVQLINAMTESGVLLLLGPKGSGKSHLARIWLARHNGQLFDATAPHTTLPATALLWEDADKTLWDEKKEKNAFHTLNMVREQKRALLITATEAPRGWPLGLADLRSRLLAIQVAQLAMPDDILTAGLILKHINDRQLRISEEVLNYLVTRTPRDGAAIAGLIETLDKAALAENRALTIPFIKSTMEKTA